MRIVDLRSDTITRPTDAMRSAMSAAEVGDDVFREDPSVNRLEELAAEKTGKEAALFVASGTMANLVSQFAHCGRGDAVILGNEAHMFFSEQGGGSALGGIIHHTIPNRPDGSLALGDIEDAIRPDNVHYPRTRLIALENTHNRCNGSPLSAGYMQTVGQLARSRKVCVHVDGARIFNAAAALNTTVAALAADADSVSFCLSKGLAAPVGSMICGTRDFIAAARRIRKAVGGGMRQAGVIAAAGIVALNEMTDRLAEDHVTAHRLAEGLAHIDGIRIDPAAFKTNIVFFRVDRDGLTPAQLSARLKAHGVLVSAMEPRLLRAVTHYHISVDDVDYALGVFERVFKE